MYSNKSKSKKLHLTPFGYLVFALAFALLLLLGYFLARAIGGASLTPKGEVTGSGDPLGKTTDINEIEPSAIDNIISAASAATNEPVIITQPPVVTKAPTPTISVATPKVYSNDEVTPTPSPAFVSRTPSPEEEANAQIGTLSTGGVNLRAGPSTNDKILGTGFSRGTKLKVYAMEQGFYFVKIISKNVYGYIAAQFVSVEGITPVPIETVVPTGATGGYVSASKAMMRRGPSKDYGAIKELAKNTMLYVYFIADDWYYCENAESGEKGYIRSDLVATNGEVLRGTPIPN